MGTDNFEELDREGSSPTASTVSARLEWAIVKVEQAAVGLAHRLDEYDTRLMDAERCIKGQATELSKTNARMDALVADREKHQKRLDDRLEEVIEATQEAEMAFLVRIERAEKRAMGYMQANANLKQQQQKGSD